MFLFKHGSFYFCFLKNPKCGSSTLYSTLRTQLTRESIIHNGAKSITEAAYDDYEYHHCNLKACVKFFEERAIPVNRAIFITTIRNPYERLISSYFYELGRRKTPFLYRGADNVQDDMLQHVQSKHVSQFYPANFRIHEGYRMTELIRVENFNSDFQSIIEKYELPVRLIDKVVNRGKKKEIELTEQTKEIVKEKYLLDFIEGSYEF